MKKFELTNEFIANRFGTKLFRIRALVEFGDVEAGELGGYVEKESNLGHDDNAWVYGNARVYGDALVYDNARVYGNAWVYGDAQVSGDARVCGNARVCGDAQVSGDALVYGNAWVCGDALVYDNARVYGNAWVYGDAQVSGDALVYGNAWVYGDAQVYGNAWVYGDAQVSGDARVCGNGDYAYAHGFGSVNRTTTFFRLKDGGVGVRCGCFYGTLAQFRDKIRETHGETKKAQEYLMLADLMELRFEEDENEVGNRKYVE